MSGLELLGIARRALAGRRFRSLLTVLSITVGAFAIVALTSLAESGLATLERGIEDLGGARLILITPKKPERAADKTASYAGGLTRRDRDQVLEGVPHLVDQSMYAVLGQRDASTPAAATTRTDLVAADERFFGAYRMRIGRGRAFLAEEERGAAKVCLVGRPVAERLWTGDAIGQRLRIGNVSCVVIGVLEEQPRVGIRFGFDWSDLVIVPFETAAAAEPGTRAGAMFLVKTDDPASNDVVKRIVNARLVERHHGVDDFTLFDFSQILENFRMVFVIMEVIVSLVAGIALLIGGVGVMNMMLVSVSERVREIGVRKALGASPRDIARQFLAESAMLAGTGGLTGVVAGAGVAALAAALIRSAEPAWVGSVSVPAAIGALTVSMIVGVVFGWLPATRAARLDPVEAMRR